jgi:hypothetical protein
MHSEKPIQATLFTTDKRTICCNQKNKCLINGKHFKTIVNILLAFVQNVVKKQSDTRPKKPPYTDRVNGEYISIKSTYKATNNEMPISEDSLFTDFETQILPNEVRIPQRPQSARFPLLRV